MSRMAEACSSGQPAARPRRIRLDDVGSLRHRPRELAGERLPQREQLELEAGDHRARSATAAQCPEEVRLGLGVNPERAPVGEHDLERGHRVAGQPAAARQPPEPAAQRVAGDADGAGEAVQRDQSRIAGRPDHVVPHRTRRRPERAAAPQSTSTPFNREVRSRIASPSAPSGAAPCPVACGATPSPFSAAKPSVATTSCAPVGDHDGRGPLVDNEIPRLPRRVPAARRRGGRHRRPAAGAARRGSRPRLRPCIDPTRCSSKACRSEPGRQARRSSRLPERCWSIDRGSASRPAGSCRHCRSWVL